MKIVLYNNYSDKRYVSKNIVSIKSYTCVVKEPCNITNPVVILKYDKSISNSNYCYLDEFKRYYYITNIQLVTGGRVELTLNCDVLMSFNGNIRQLECVIERQEFLNNPQIIDNELPIRSERLISHKNIGGLGNSSTIILTVTGGRQSIEDGNNVEGSEV